MGSRGAELSQYWPKWYPNGSHMVPKWSQHGPKMVPKWVQNGPKWVLGALQGANLIMGSILKAILAPFWIQKGPQKSSKIMFMQTLNTYQILKCFWDTFCIDFDMIFKHFSMHFYTDSIPYLKMLMLRITPYYQWFFMIFSERRTQEIKKVDTKNR